MIAVSATVPKKSVSGGTGTNGGRGRASEGFARRARVAEA